MSLLHITYHNNTNFTSTTIVTVTITFFHDYHRNSTSSVKLREEVGIHPVPGRPNEKRWR